MLNLPAISFAASLVAAGLMTEGTPSIGNGAPEPNDSAIVATASAYAFGPFFAQQGEAEDAAITANVKDAIATRIGPGAAQINVETRAAIVTLSGAAPSSAIRVLIREAAWTVSGVVDVVDKLDVTPTA